MSENDGRPTRLSSVEGVATRIRSPESTDQEFTRGLVESVNHHLRTPLTAVLGHAELLSEQEHELPAELHQSLACLLRAARRLNDVVLGVCDLVDIAYGDPDGIGSVDISELVAEEVTACQDRAALRGVRFLVSGEPVLECIADSRRLRRALRELLDNALTYAPDRSTVRVASTTSPMGIRIKVSDQGDGIDSADRERLARPFERGTHPRQPTASRGMGLALASAVAASLGGRLVLSESLGRGLQACIELPFDLTHLRRASAAETLAQS